MKKTIYKIKVLKSGLSFVTVLTLVLLNIYPLSAQVVEDTNVVIEPPAVTEVTETTPLIEPLKIEVKTDTSVVTDSSVITPELKGDIEIKVEPGDTTAAVEPIKQIGNGL